jgi:hypothetical protein
MQDDAKDFGGCASDVQQPAFAKADDRLWQDPGNRDDGAYFVI